LEFVDHNLGISQNACLSQAEALVFAGNVAVGNGIFVIDNGSAYPCN